MSGDHGADVRHRLQFAFRVQLDHCGRRYRRGVDDIHQEVEDSDDEHAADDRQWQVSTRTTDLARDFSRGRPSEIGEADADDGQAHHPRERRRSGGRPEM